MKKQVADPRQNQAGNLVLNRGFILSVLDDLAVEKQTRWTSTLRKRYNTAVRLLQP